MFRLNGMSKIRKISFTQKMLRMHELFLCSSRKMHTKRLEWVSSLIRDMLVRWTAYVTQDFEEFVLSFPGNEITPV